MGDRPNLYLKFLYTHQGKPQTLVSIKKLQMKQVVSVAQRIMFLYFSLYNIKSKKGPTNRKLEKLYNKHTMFISASNVYDNHLKPLICCCEILSCNSMSVYYISDKCI